MDLTITGVLLPVLVAALAEAWNDHKFAPPLALASLFVWLYWYSVKKRRMDFLQLRLKRARDLEEIAGLDHHRSILNADSQRGVLPYLGILLRMRRVESYASIALFWAWLLFFYYFGVLTREDAAFLMGLVSGIDLIADFLEYRKRRGTRNYGWLLKPTWFWGGWEGRQPKP